MSLERPAILLALIVTLTIHSGLGAGLYGLHRFAGFLTISGVLDALRNSEVDIEVIDTKRQPPPPKVVEPLPEPKIAEPIAPPQRVAPKTTKPRRVVARNPQPKVPRTPPAPGPVTENDSAAKPYVIPDIQVGGNIGVGTGTPTPKWAPVGSGKGGKGTGGGGKEPASGPPSPVSIATIKTMPVPLAQPSYDKKDYPAAAKKRGIQGVVKVQLVVSDSGKVVKARVVKGLGHGLNQWALRLAKRLRFKPAINTNGDKVTARLVWSFRFVLPR